MKTLLLRAAAAAAAAFAFAPVPAAAQTTADAPDAQTTAPPAAEATAEADPVPAGPVRMYLKDHPALPLAAEDGALVLAAEPDAWTIRAVEALQPLGEYQIVLDATGECVATDTGGGGEAVPVFLAECGAAAVWSVVYDDADVNQDLRFTTADGYFLGLTDDADAVAGAAVQAVLPESGASLHFQEWLFAGPPEDAPSETPSTEAAPSPGPKLPTTGAGLAPAIGTAALAVAGGVALLLWRLRRRALRSEW